MGIMRDWFSKAGLCDDTVDNDRKPELIKRLIAFSKQHYAGDPVREDGAESYDDRMRAAFSKAKSASLDRLLREGVTVCLDRRLGDYRQGWMDNGEIHALYWDDSGAKILSLYDRGTSAMGLAHRGNTDFSGSVIDGLVPQLDFLASFLVGGIVRRTDSVALMRAESRNDGILNRGDLPEGFAWDLPGNYSRELNQNPGLMRPPFQPRSLTPSAQPQPSARLANKPSGPG